MVNCNQVQTEVISEGRWIEEEPLPHSTKKIVLVITGNPGIPGFYQDFIKAINSKLSFDAPVWVVGHAGHVQPPENLDIAMPSNKKWRDHYGLTAQVQHKVLQIYNYTFLLLYFSLISIVLLTLMIQVEFIKTYVPEDAELYLIGHSIGAWVVLNLMKNQDINKRVKKSYLLFPTIEHMAETPNGRIFRNFVSICISSHYYNIYNLHDIINIMVYFVQLKLLSSHFQVSRIAPLLIFLSWFFTTMFPTFLQMFMISVFNFFYGIPGKYNKVIRGMLDPRVLYRIINLGREELKVVKEADHDTISKHSDKLWFYYGTIDGWVPVKYYKNMISKHLNLNAQLCQRGFYHSFVLQHDVGMGHIVGDLINNG